jgi:hypothetical protein
MKKYIIDTIDNYTMVNNEIFGKYLDYFQRRMNHMLVKVLNDEKMNIYGKPATEYINTQAHILSDEFLDYKDFFPDYTGHVKFVTEVSDLKKRFMQDCNRDTSCGDAN